MKNIDYYNIFKEKGYFCINNFLTESYVTTIKQEILNLVEMNIGTIYHDRKGAIRRMENFTFNSHHILSVNNKVLNLLEDIFGEEYILFKDKVNFKPPGGEGFYAHYDGIFIFSDINNNLKKGWYEYCDNYVNVLIALDDFTITNGALEVGIIHNLNFMELLSNTKLNGTPDLTISEELKIKFEPILISSGSILIFDHKCPHRSMKNNSKYNRQSLYLTYNPKKLGDFYNIYFQDKYNSKNLTSKSLSGLL